MRTLFNGTTTRRTGRLELDAIEIHDEATFVNQATVHTWTTVSSGSIQGTGTWWARRDTSRPIGGTIDAGQVIIYWPSEMGITLPVWVGWHYSIQKQTGEGELT